MVKDCDNSEGTGLKDPSDSDSENKEMGGGMVDDNDTSDSDQSENVREGNSKEGDSNDDNYEADVSEQKLFSTEESTKGFATRSEQRHVKLVLSKSRTSITPAGANKKLTSDGNHSTNTPMKINNNPTTKSPIRIKLSLKKLPLSNKLSLDNDAREPTSCAKSNSTLNNNDKNISNENSGKSSNNGNDDQASKSIEIEVNKKSSKMLIPTPHDVSANNIKQSSDHLLTSNIAKVSMISKVATGTASKRRSLVPSKQVRMPPLTSPGLRMLRPPIHMSAPPPSNGATSSPTYFTPQQVFDVVMSDAGYTHEQRTFHPHRGSSVQRTIDDMFDTNVHLSLHPIELVPKHLWNYVVDDNEASSDSHMLNDSTSHQNTDQLPHRLIAALENSKKSRIRKTTEENYNSIAPPRKRPRPGFEPLQLHDMVPVSLTIPYPEWYLQKRVEYVKMVKQRETAIIEWQAAQEEIEMSGGEHHLVSDTDVSLAKSNDSPVVNPKTIPPIPQPPDPPKIHELMSQSDKNPMESGEDNVRIANLIAPYVDIDALGRDNKAYDESMHPYYLPRDKENLVWHLDPNCFHVVDGRYFGLETNLIADPNFIGPNVPGLSGSTNTGGLATATSSTTTSTSGLTGGGMTMILSASYHSAAAVAPASLKEDSAVAYSTKLQPIQSEDVPIKSNSPNDHLVDASSTVVLPPSEKQSKVDTNKMRNDISTTKTLSDLRSIMEGNDVKLIESFRECIVRSVVHTYRSHKSMNVPFRGPNHESYPDIGKAFACYGGIKPCDRCKSNKQGVLHCRVRRRHDDPDYDGGQTSKPLLLSLLDAPLESLLTIATPSRFNAI